VEAVWGRAGKHLRKAALLSWYLSVGVKMPCSFVFPPCGKQLIAAAVVVVYGMLYYPMMGLIVSRREPGWQQKRLSILFTLTCGYAEFATGLYSAHPCTLNCAIVPLSAAISATPLAITCGAVTCHCAACQDRSSTLHAAALPRQVPCNMSKPSF
jgi:hypothetical protein